MTNALEGLSIPVPESRELDLFAAMLEAEGATASRCPLVKILDLKLRGERRLGSAPWLDAAEIAMERSALLTGDALKFGRLQVHCAVCLQVYNVA